MDAKIVTIADNIATVTIADPKRSAIYFFPNRPLVEDGDEDANFFQCFLVPPSEGTFSATINFIAFSDGEDTSTRGFSLSQLNGTRTIDGVDLTPYAASVGSSATGLLLSRSLNRSGIRFEFATGEGYTKDRDDGYTFTCYATLNSGARYPADPTAPTKRLEPSQPGHMAQGSFGDVKFGQAYETAAE